MKRTQTNDTSVWDELAIQFASEKNERVFGQLHEMIWNPLWFYVKNLVKDEETTADIVLKTIEQIYFRIDQFDHRKGRFSTWIYKIAFNYSLKVLTINDGDIVEYYIPDWKYDSIREPETYSDYMMVHNELTSYSKEKIIQELHEVTIACIELLPPDQKFAMTQRLIFQKKINDIADEFQVPISSLKNWIYYGRQHLRQIVMNKYPELYSLYSGS